MTFRNDNEFTEGIKTTIRNSTMPYAIRATAGLLYWFAVEAGIIPIQVPFETLPQALSHAKVGQTIRIAPVAYDLTASATIPNGIKLEVSPGATLKFKNNSRLTVNGTLDAIGTPSQRIIFDGMGQIQTDETDALIRINGMASDNHAYIKYANIKNANCLVYANHLYRLSIENCTFSQFSNTPFGYALNIIDYTRNTPTNVKNNIITGLWDYGYEDILPVGIKVSTWEQNPSWDLRRVTIEGNTITKCYKAIEIQHANVKIKNNTIRDSYKGIEFNHAQAEINSNILRENVYGVYLLSSQVGFIYNTIYNNSELGIWSQNSYSNFTRNRVSHNLMGTYFYSSASNFRENYIGDNGLWQVMSDHLSNSIFGGANIGETRGYNAIVGTSTSSDVITVSGGSYVELGAYDPGSEYNLRGYNSIIRNNSIGKHITVSSGTANAGYCYFNLPLAVVGNVYVYNMDYGPGIGSGPWPDVPQGSMSQTFFGGPNVLKNNKTTNQKSEGLLSALTTMDARFDSAMRKRSKEEVLLTLGLSYKAKKRYELAITTFEKIIKGSNRTKFDTDALVLLYSTYREQLFDSSNSSLSQRSQNRNSLKQKLINISIFNSDIKVNNIANVMLAKEMVRFGELNDAISAYQYLEQENKGQEEQKYILFDLFSIYIHEKKDTASAKSILSKLEKQFPDDELITFAKAEMRVFDAVRKSPTKKLTKVELSIEESLPKTFELSQNYPNPFNPTTTIKYQLPEDSYVTLTIHDIQGREVARLSDGVNSSGYYESFWNGKNKQNISVSSGIYFYRISAKPLKNSKNMFTATKKMLLLK